MNEIALHGVETDPIEEELTRRERAALSMGGEAKLAKRRDKGILNARERIEHLIDKGSFREIGQLGVSTRAEDRSTTPADGKVTGFARVGGRPVAVVSNDFTVKGASSSMTNMRKIGHVKRAATERGMPIVFLGESSGARMPDNMGARGMGTMLGNDPTQYIRDRKTPWAAAVLGQCFGSSAWYTCLSDFAVMRKGAVLAVASHGLASLAIGQTVEPEDLGGWQLHSDRTGLIDRVVDTDEEALEEIRRFLSYMPSHANEAPPRLEAPDEGSDDIRAAAARMNLLVPKGRRQGYDVRKVVEAIADPGSVFELKPRLGKVATTALARLGGQSVGFVANNPMFKAGALDVDACEKITRFLVMCDSFNIPIVMLVDTPGFVIGIEGERRKAPGKIMNFMSALQLCTVPKLSVIMRKSYGQAYLNMGGGMNSDAVAAWPSAEVSFMDPNYAVDVVTWGRDASGEERNRIRTAMEQDSTVFGLAEMNAVQAVIRPTETRTYLLEMLEIHTMRPTAGVGRHQMACWPTTY
ncbi:acyl-CoA carboxylase subunit beta [Nitratireductor indicus]|uniref:Carboxyl transferase n=1 Tax=Nitratireductor indicus C115 TaxID=1231190 RepID=K2P7M7_9HYPH|nr:carboxyl transferase domain-containing protein [Nitratireductor indicus]EKF43236.1 carboxyl transferase [Nitratireductor indicus C115]MDS1137789.1 carboxyl transferase domain-containing protein [Nitratireductor indicus]SFQ53948.1 Acetyl-CoA carboxylase, carboxyltransferase component [Nitratireductor indicus]